MLPRWTASGVGGQGPHSLALASTALSHSSAMALNAQVCDEALLIRNALLVVVILTLPYLHPPQPHQQARLLSMFDACPFNV